jgi:septal ring factor EnvC (AmiA/AmiB activator)
MADLATLQTRLTEAEAAYHQLALGTKEVEVEHGDMRMKYTQATMEKLAAYIADLRAQIAALGGTLTGQRRRALMVDL